MSMREIAKTENVLVVPAPTPKYKPTESEWAAIRKGEEEVARGESISLTDLKHELGSKRRTVSSKATRKVSR
jgi:hypothetical protein